jgi:hypothetical protein
MLDQYRGKWGCAVNAVLVAFIVTVPAMAIIFGRAPARRRYGSAPPTPCV